MHGVGSLPTTARGRAARAFPRRPRHRATPDGNCRPTL